MLRVPGRPLHVCTLALTSHDRLSIGRTLDVADLPESENGQTMEERIYPAHILSYTHTYTHTHMYTRKMFLLSSKTASFFDAVHFQFSARGCCSKRCRSTKLHRLESNSFHRNIIVRRFVKDLGKNYTTRGMAGRHFVARRKPRDFRRDGKSVCILYFDEVILGYILDIFDWALDKLFVTTVCILMYMWLRRNEMFWKVIVLRIG